MSRRCRQPHCESLGRSEKVSVAPEDSSHPSTRRKIPLRAGVGLLRFQIQPASENTANPGGSPRKWNPDQSVLCSAEPSELQKKNI